MTTLTTLMEQIDWQKMQGLVPAIIQHHENKTVLMLGYMNQTALEQTLHSKRVTFFSRSKQRLWQKGETSGHYLEYVEAYLDCDQDALLVLVKPIGPTCHLNRDSCFNTSATTPKNDEFINDLQKLLEQRKQQPHANSYTHQLMTAGTARIAQKVGEEGVEVAIAAVIGETTSLLNEMADLFFHMLVLLSAKSLHFNQVITILQQRHLEATQKNGF